MTTKGTKRTVVGLRAPITGSAYHIERPRLLESAFASKVRVRKRELKRKRRVGGGGGHGKFGVRVRVVTTTQVKQGVGSGYY